MRHVVLLRAATNTAGGWIDFSAIIYKGNGYRITKEHKCVLNTEALPSDQPLFMRIDPAKPYSLNYDDDPSNKDPKNAERKKCCEIIPYHHQVNTVEGFVYYLNGKAQSQNPNAGSGMVFEFEDMAANHAKNVKIVKMMGAAYNKANDMSYAEKLNVMYYYGENPTNLEGNMKHSEVFMRLVEPGFGVVYRRTMFAQTGKTFLDHFVNDYNASDSSYVLKTTVLKAQYVKGQDGKTLIYKEGSAWMFGNDVIGSSVEEAMVWFMNHEKLKDHVISAVAKADTINDDDLDEVLTKYDKPSEASIQLKAKTDYDDLHTRAEKLRMPLSGRPTIDSLKEKIAYGEAVWEKVKEFGLEDEIESQPRLRIEKIELMVKDKQKQLLKKEKEPVA